MWKAPSWISAPVPERRRTHPLEAAEQRRARQQTLCLLVALTGGFLLFASPAWLAPPVGTGLLALVLAGIVGPIAWRVTSIAEDRRHTATAGAVVAGIAISTGLAGSLPWFTAVGWAGLVAWTAWWTARRRVDVDATVTKAQTDAVTGLPQRSIFERKATGVLALADPADGVALIVLDLDHLKTVNDEHGHLAGDAALKVIADALRTTLRDRDLRTRWGGDEFAVLAYGLDPAGAVTLAERLRGAIEHAGATQPRAITASIGLAYWEGPSESWASLWARADLASYRSKLSGRNLVHASIGSNAATWSEAAAVPALDLPLLPGASTMPVAGVA